MKKQVLHTVVWKERKLFIAKFLELEIASQGKTKEKAISNLKEAAELYFDGENIDNLRFPSIESVSTQAIPL